MKLVKKGYQFYFLGTIFKLLALVFKTSKHWLSLIQKNQNTYQTRIFLDDLVESRYFFLKRVQ